MIARGFKSVIWVATVGGAALGCYMVSLRVATERNELAKVERQIVEARRDIRELQTELGTRGRMTQLEQWNAEVLALSAPSSAQFMKDEFTLARLYRTDPTVAERSAEIRLASAEAAKPEAPAVVRAVAEPPAAAAPLIHRASFTPGETGAKPAAAKPAKPAAARRTDSAPPAEAVQTAKPERQPTRTAAKPDAVPPRGAAGPVKPEAVAARTAEKPAKAATAPGRTAAKPLVAAARPLREAEAEPRQAKVKASGGN